MNTIITADFNGTPIHFSGDAFVNLSDMCRAKGKKPALFLRLASTKEYIALLQEDLMCSNNTSKPAFVVQKLHHKTSIPGVLFASNIRGQAGTWAHPDLAMECARWLDKRFSIWCNRIIRSILTGELVIGPAPLPAKLPPFLSEWHHQRFLAKKAAVEELLTASQQWGRFLKTAEEIQARHLGERGFSSRSLIRDFYRWEENGFDDLSLLIGFTKKAA